MSGYALAMLSARIGDAIREGQEVLDADEYGALLEMVAVVLSRAVADEFERRWNEEGR